MYLAIDIGGTATRVAASKNGRTFFSIEKFKTPKKFEHGLRMIVEHIRRLGLPAVLRGGRASRYINGIAVAVPGSIDKIHGTLLNLPNLPDWSSKPIILMMHRLLHTKAKVLLINDADAAGLGEATCGAGKGFNRVGYLTLSTGIGGALVVSGKLAVSAEPGHHLMIPGGKKCGCGARGCFEAYGSGTAFYKTYGVRPENCKNKKIWAKHAQIIGWGVINTLRFWSPDVLVLGGGLTKAGPLLFYPLRQYLFKHLQKTKLPPIRRAKLGDNAGLYGGLSLLTK